MWQIAELSGKATNSKFLEVCLQLKSLAIHGVTNLAQWWHLKADDTARSRDYSPGIFWDLMTPGKHILGEFSW